MTTPDSTVPSDTDRLADIRARLDAATPGPWHRKGKAVLGPREESDLGTGPAALLHTGMPYDGPEGRCGANAELAAHAPDDLAYLLGELDDAQRLFDALGSEAAEELKAAHATLTTLQGRLDTAEGQLDKALAELDEQRWYGEQMQASLDSCSGNHLPIEDYDESALGLGGEATDER